MSKWGCLRQKASITYGEFVNFQNLNYFLTLLQSMKRESKDLIVLRGSVFPHGAMSFSLQKPDHIKHTGLSLLWMLFTPLTLGLSHFFPSFW